MAEGDGRQVAGESRAEAVFYAGASRHEFVPSGGRAEAFSPLQPGTLAALFEHAPLLMAVLDTDLRYLSVNREFVRVFSPDSVPGENSGGKPADFIGGSHIERVMHSKCRGTMLDALRTGQVHFAPDCPLPAPTPGGEMFLDWTFTPLTDPTGGPPVALALFAVEVTERVRALAAEQEQSVALRRSQAELSGILFNMQDTVYRSRLSGEIVWISPSVEQLLGFRAEDLIGTDAERLYADSGMRRELLDALRRQGGRIRSFQITMRHKDGNPVKVHLNAKYFFGPDGAVAGIEGVLHDVSGLYSAHEELCRSEGELSAILQNMQDTYYRTGRDGRLLRVSPSVRCLLGYPCEDLEQGPLDALFVEPEGGNGLISALKASGGQVRDHVIPMRHRDGHVVWVSTSAQYYRNRRGNIAGIEGTARDVTATLRMAEALRESEARLAEAQTIARLGSWEWEVASGRVFGSDETLRLLGWSDGWEGRTLDDFLRRVHEDDREHVRLALDDTLRRFLPYDTQFRLRDDQGRQRTVRHMAVVTEGEGGARVVGAIQDVTELARTQEERERFQSQLLQAQKMEAVGILAGGVAHDFNNLLTTIGGFTELALARTAPDDSRYRDLEEVRQAVERAASLTRQLLLFSRKQPLTMATQDIGQRVAGLRNMLERLIGEDIVIRTHLDPALWPVRADGVSFDQLLMNLAINARDAMPGGGRLTIRAENVTVTGADVGRHPDASAGSFVRVMVADTGVGMDAVTLASIFDPFFTTKEIGKGTGLGMSVVHGIARQHGGWIEVDSRPGRGSVFTVFFPAFPATRVTDSGPTITVEEAISVGRGTVNGMRAAVEPGGGGHHILLVEDEPALRSFAHTALTKNGYRVTPCGTLREAAELLDKGEIFDLVFSDVVLPDGSGIQLADRAAVAIPGTPVLLCSGYPDQKAGWSVLQQRGIPFLQKPYTLTQLMSAVGKGTQKCASAD
ncbi:MAG: PAS domain S-box protein [Nitrospirota bacterium]|nr:PAS domain S-box protein [Nitrospirota bacterium]